VNARLCSIEQQRKLFVDPKCKSTIECLERQIYKEGSSQPDKDAGYDHMNDALGYMVDYMFPVTRAREERHEPKRWTHQIAA
jgi:hypothetical protein